MLKQRIQRFFDSRSPRQDQFSLSLKNIYVFASRQGRLFLALLVVTFIAGVNYGNNLILGLFFYLLSVWLVSAVLSFLQLSALSVAFEQAKLTQAGQLLWVQLHLSNHQGKPSRQIELSFYDLDDTKFQKTHLKNDQLNPKSPLFQQLTYLSQADLHQFLHARKVIVAEVVGEVVVRLPVLTDGRGAVVLPRLNIKSTYPLGVVQAWSYAFFASMGFAYPVPIAFDEQAQKSPTSDGNAAYAAQVGQDEFDHLDSYKVGESLARVSWGHVARGAGMLTKHFADPVGDTVSIDYYAMPASTHEDKLAQMSFALLALDNDTPCEFVLPSHKTQGVGADFVQACLLALAKEP